MQCRWIADAPRWQAQLTITCMGTPSVSTHSAPGLKSAHTLQHLMRRLYVQPQHPCLFSHGYA